MMARNSEKVWEVARRAVWWPEIAIKSGSERDRVMARDCKDKHEEPSNGERESERGRKRA